MFLAYVVWDRMLSKEKNSKHSHAPHSKKNLATNFFFLNIFPKKIFLLVAQMHGYGMLVIGPRQTTFRQTSHNDHMIRK